MPTHHADGLAQGIGVHAARDVLREFAELQRADRARMLHHFETAEDVALRVGERLALLGAQGARDPAHVLAHQRLEFEHNASPSRDRRALPGLERLLGRGHRGLELGVGRERHLCKHLLRGRVHDVVPFAGL